MYVCVCMEVTEKGPGHTDTVTDIQTHNQKKAKKGKQAEARHTGVMQTEDTGRE